MRILDAFIRGKLQVVLVDKITSEIQIMIFTTESRLGCPELKIKKKKNKIEREREGTENARKKRHNGMNKHLVIVQAIEFGIQEIVEDASILVCLTVLIICQRIENLTYDI